MFWLVVFSGFYYYIIVPTYTCSTIFCVLCVQLNGFTEQIGWAVACATDPLAVCVHLYIFSCHRSAQLIPWHALCKPTMQMHLFIVDHNKCHICKANSSLRAETMSGSRCITTSHIICSWSPYASAVLNEFRIWFQFAPNFQRIPVVESSFSSRGSRISVCEWALAQCRVCVLRVPLHISCKL